MKIVCDNCATKYSIADEKVRGKVFKIRCKKCSHIIVVRGGADGSVEASRDAAPAAGAGFPGEDDQATMAAGQPVRSAGTPGGGVAMSGGDSVWHLVIDREQVGPLTHVEVRAKFAGGEIDAETYAWREGFGDWLRLASIEDFRDLGGGAAAAGNEGATRRTDSADLFAAAGGGDDAASDAPAGDLFGGGAAAPAYSSAPAPAAEADVFGGGGGGGGLFGAPSASPAPRAARTSSPGFAASAAPSAEPAGGGGVDVRPMTGQRNENSVLFSLNNLQALATGGGGPGKSSSAPEPRPGFANSQTEGSGLIDIRAMAASTLAASPSPGSSGHRGDELPGLGAAPVFSPMAAPILMPAAPSGPPKWMFAILGVGVMAVLGIVVVGILLLTRKPEQPVVAALPPGSAAAAPTVGAPAAAAAGNPTAAGTPAAVGTPAAAGTPGAAVAQNDKGEEKKHAAKSSAAHEKGTKVAKADTAPAAKGEPAAAKAEAPAAPAPKKGKHDALDDLLNDASPESKPAAKKAAAREESSGGGADESLPETLDRGSIVAGMAKVKPRVVSCNDQYHVPGTVNVALTISGNGRISSAAVTGQFAGTPTGDCVARAVKSASFPRFKGANVSIVYPYAFH